jgi:hypothetical protein
VLVSKLLAVRDTKDGDKQHEAPAAVRNPVRGNGGQPVKARATASKAVVAQAEHATTTPAAIDTEHCASCGAAVSRKVHDDCLARPAASAAGCTASSTSAASARR